MRTAARILLWGYGAMLCAVGFAGIWISGWELDTVHHLATESWPPAVRASFLNQYRFLKGVELGGGLFCLGLQARILDGGREGALFLALVAAGVVARVFAWIADGRPSTAFIVFLALEFLVLVVVGLFLRGRRDA